MASVNDFKTQEQLRRFLESPHLWVIKPEGKVQEIVQTSKCRITAAIRSDVAVWITPDGEDYQLLFNNEFEALRVSMLVHQQQLQDELEKLRTDIKLNEKVFDTNVRRKIETGAAYLEGVEVERRLVHLSVKELRAMLFALSEKDIDDLYDKKALILCITRDAVSRFGREDVYAKLRKWWWGGARQFHYAEISCRGTHKTVLTKEDREAIDGVVRDDTCVATVTGHDFPQEADV